MTSGDSIRQETVKKMKHNEFKTYHPIVNFTYFLFVIYFGMVFVHPLCLGIALVGRLSYTAFLGGWKKILYMLPLVILAALINPAFNHAGVTVLAYLPSGNPLTLESIMFGAVTAVIIIAVICWFSCYNAVMTSDKFIYLFGRAIPSLSLILSMTLCFVPRFSAQFKRAADAQRGLGRDVSNGSVIKRAKTGLSILSVMITWALENSIETADSMKARGYGLSGRTAFSIFKFDKRDKKALFLILALGLYVFLGQILGQMYFRYIPSMKAASPTILGLSFFLAYLALCLFPVVVEISEAVRWKHIS